MPLVLHVLIKCHRIVFLLFLCPLHLLRLSETGDSGVLIGYFQLPCSRWGRCLRSSDSNLRYFLSSYFFSHFAQRLQHLLSLLIWLYVVVRLDILDHLLSYLVYQLWLFVHLSLVNILSQILLMLLILISSSRNFSCLRPCQFLFVFHIITLFVLLRLFKVLIKGLIGPSVRRFWSICIRDKLILT